MNVRWSYLGVVPYVETVDLMQRLRDRVHDEAADDFILMLQHKPVITQGNSQRGSEGGLLLSREEIVGKGIQVLQTDRGGKTTYHGPGQLVAYLIIDLKRRGWKIKSFVREVMDMTCQVLDSYGIAAEVNEKDPGVTVQGEKIAFFGFNVKGHVTMHGFSLNVNNDLTPFSFVEPCGHADLKVTSMEKVCGQRYSLFDVYWRFITYFGDRYGDDLEEVFVEDFEAL